ncbi:MAG: hypothetical protein WKG07_29790 [Hymenobacter sp.]
MGDQGDPQRLAERQGPVRRAATASGGSGGRGRGSGGGDGLEMSGWRFDNVPIVAKPGRQLRRGQLPALKSTMTARWSRVTQGVGQRVAGSRRSCAATRC